jgi:predicted amidohydrolase YtcJ
MYNGTIYTMDESKIASAIVLENEKIIYVGDDESALAYQTTDSWLLDLSKETVIPGLNDSHLHLYGLSLTRKQLSLLGSTSVQEVMDKTSTYINNHQIAPGKWVVGRGWNQDFFEGEIRFPTKSDLDQISGAHPIVLTRVCGHMMIVNSKALEFAGITKDALPPSGGRIDFEAGMLSEKALGMVYKNIPDPDDAELEKMLRETMAYANSKGVTTLQTDDLYHLSQSDFHRMMKMYQKLDKEQKLTCRLVLQALLPQMEQLKAFIEEGYPNQVYSTYLKAGPLKILTDGTLGARTAAMRKPYHDDPLTKGLYTYQNDELYEIIETAHLAHMSVALHAIGDGAMTQVLDVIEEVLNKYPKDDHRHAIVHCQITDDEICNRMKKLNITAIVQPIFLDNDLHIVKSRVGEELASTSYAFGSMLKKGIRVAIGTDAPIEDVNPFPNIYAAVTRKDKLGMPQEGHYPNEALSVEEAVYNYTVTCAYSSFDEEKTGMIKPGMLADLVVLDRNIFTISPNEIKDTEVLLTFVGGNLVYQKKA